jgi:uncharacterized OB-fold protein
MTTPGSKYVPEPDGLNLAFHRASVAGSLHLQRCDHCGHFRHPPRFLCPECASDRWTWTPVSGRGRVYSWVVTHFTVDRGWVDDVPYTTVAVELDERPRVLGALRSGAAQLHVGQPVTVSVEAKGADFVFLWVDPT